MKLTAVQIRYLLATYQLSKKGIVRSSEIADSLGVSRPSTHRMLDQLMKMNLIMKEQHSFINLTESGRETAEQHYDCFIHISRSLRECLNLSRDIAENGALAILSKLDATTLRDFSMRMDSGRNEDEKYAE